VFQGTVTNCGTVPLTNVQVNGSLCGSSVGSLAPGQTKNWSCTVPGTGMITNVVTATATATGACAGAVSSNTTSATCVISFCEGCTPGYWKNHTERWDNPSDPIAQAAGFTTQTNFYTFFGIPPGTCGLPNSLTMLQAVNLGGGGAFKLARHGIPGLLNFAAGLNYGLPGTTIKTAAQLKQAITEALSACTPEPLATQIAAGNELGDCPLN
jgi:hypothetical protein